MNKGLTFTLSFTVGAAIGSAVTWKILKTKYEQLAREEIEEVREYYATKDEKTEDTEEDSEKQSKIEFQDIVKDARTEYFEIASKYSSNDENKEGGEESMSRHEPYVISPAEFGEMEKYETITLIYYNDGVLADQDNNIIEDIESCIGYECLNHFGEHGEDDIVRVRNEDAMTDYEVVMDETDYADLEDIIG